MLNVNTRERTMDLWPEYLNSNVPMQWNGNIDTGNPGQLSTASKNAIMCRINWARKMAGVEHVLNDVSLNDDCQALCLYLSANPKWVISHTLSRVEGIRWWTQKAADAAKRSCIDRMDDGPKSIMDMLRDFDMAKTNETVGHRRWLLDHKRTNVGIGCVPGSLKNPASCAVYVNTPPRTVRGPVDVAWPPAGYAPMVCIPERWSFSPAEGDVTRARVFHNGLAMPTVRQNSSIISPVVVWKPRLTFNEEDTHLVEINNVIVDGQAKSWRYTVSRFRP